MDEYSLYDAFEDLEDLQDSGPFTRIRNAAQARRPRLRSQKEQVHKPVEAELAELAAEEDITAIEFTYKASKTEALWLAESLGFFYQNRWIDDVLQLVKGGKEASVYLCAANPSSGLDYLAAKVYRPRRFRSLRNDYLYREGRDRLDADGNPIIDDKDLHAMDKRTAYGRQLSHTSWIEHEVRALNRLSEAGVPVPRVYSRGQNAILMDYIGDRTMPAPTLNAVQLEPGEGGGLLRPLLEYVELALSLDIIHGDLSAYNILYWEGDVTLIDFPQVVSPLQNRNAYAIFRRDVRRLCEYFADQGVTADSKRISEEMWQRQGLRLTPDVHPGLLDDQDEEDLAFWQGKQDGG
ncbi:MAG: RIO1 family regulatory kinase/ATPase [Anaerolineales bacterium]|nr:RIO1 family regulatory kinase/ATPase [Anaerolineales bacterium]